MQDIEPFLACNSFKEITTFIINYYYDTSLLGRLQKKKNCVCCSQRCYRIVETIQTGISSLYFTAFVH